MDVIKSMGKNFVFRLNAVSMGAAHHYYVS